MEPFYIFVHKKDNSSELLPFLHAAFEERFTAFDDDVLYARIQGDETLDVFEDLYNLWIDDLGESFTISVLPIIALDLFDPEIIALILQSLPYAYYTYDHLLFAAISKSEDLKGMIRKRVAPYLSGPLVSTIRYFAKNNMNVSVCAKNMYLHRNTLMYRLDQIDELTGLNPRAFKDMHVLYSLFY